MVRISLWLSLDRGFVSARKCWNGVSLSIMATRVQLDRAALEEAGWTTVWKDAQSETQIRNIDEGLVVGGYRLEGIELLLHPPNYTSEYCLSLESPCSIEWSMMDLEGHLRSNDNNSLTLLVGQAVNVEVNRELQNSGGLILAMGAIIVLLYLSLRRWSLMLEL